MLRRSLSLLSFGLLLACTAPPPDTPALATPPAPAGREMSVQKSGANLAPVENVSLPADTVADDVTVTIGDHAFKLVPVLPSAASAGLPDLGHPFDVGPPDLGAMLHPPTIVPRRTVMKHPPRPSYDDGDGLNLGFSGALDMRLPGHARNGSGRFTGAALHPVLVPAYC